MRNNLMKITYSLLLTIFSLFISKAYALEASVENLIDSEECVVLKLQFESIQEMVKYLDERVIQINFDDTKLNYQKFDYVGSLHRKSIVIDRKPQSLNLTLRANKHYKKLKYNLGIPELIDIRLKVARNDISPCEVPIEIKTMNGKRKIEKSIFKTFLPIGNPEVDKCKLSKLVPDIGTLTPVFDPDIHDYEMTVDHDIKSLDFETVPMLENLDVKVAHRNLSAPGKYTDVTITVSNPDLKMKEIYTVHVYREEKAEISKEKSTKSKNKSPKSDNKKKVDVENRTELVSSPTVNSENNSITTHTSQSNARNVSIDNSQEISRTRSEGKSKTLSSVLDSDLNTNLNSNSNSVSSLNSNPDLNSNLDSNCNLNPTTKSNPELIIGDEPINDSAEDEKYESKTVKSDSSAPVLEIKTDDNKDNTFRVCVLSIFLTLVISFIAFWILKSLKSDKKDFSLKTMINKILKK